MISGLQSVCMQTSKAFCHCHHGKELERNVPSSEHGRASRPEGAKECPEDDSKEHPGPGGNEGIGDLAGPGNFSRFQEPVPLMCGCALWK